MFRDDLRLLFFLGGALELVRILSVVFLKFTTLRVCTVSIRLHRILREEICERIVAEKRGNLAKTKQVLQYVLAQEPSDDSHCGWQ